MAFRTVQEAAEQYRRSVQRVVSCVSPAVITLQLTGRGAPSSAFPTYHFIELGDETGASLQSSARLRLKVLTFFEVVPVSEQANEWIARTRGYMNSIRTGDHGELVAYHWHRLRHASVAIPHLHVGPSVVDTATQIGSRHVHRLHFPTGPVPLSSIVRMTIEELDVRPLRDDWDAVLAEHQTT